MLTLHKLKNNRLTIFLSLVWRRVDSRCKGGVSIKTAWEVSRILYLKRRVNNDMRKM